MFDLIVLVLCLLGIGVVGGAAVKLIERIRRARGPFVLLFLAAIALGAYLGVVHPFGGR